MKKEIQYKNREWKMAFLQKKFLQKKCPQKKYLQKNLKAARYK
jgi:hypothetical protein